MQPKNMLRKNLPKALTAVLSPSRSANRAQPGSSSRNGRSHRRRRSECNSHVWSTYPPTFFFCHRSGYETRKRMGVLLNTDIEASRYLKGSEDAHISLPYYFFFFGCAPPAPPQGGEGTASGAQGMSRLSKAQFNQRQG